MGGFIVCLILVGWVVVLLGMIVYFFMWIIVVWIVYVQIDKLMEQFVEGFFGKGLDLYDLVGLIEFCDVDFWYLGVVELVLIGVLLWIELGEYIVLIGLIGLGKFIIVWLIFGFYLFISGLVFIDGIDLCQLSLMYLCSWIGVLFQDNVFLIGLIWENIKFGCEDVGDEEMICVLKMVLVYDFVLWFLFGYDFILVDWGEGLFGGQ